MTEQITPCISTPAVVCVGEACREEAAVLAAHLGARLLYGYAAAEAAPLWLQLDGKGLSLTDGRLTLRGDFTQMLSRLRPGELQRELLVKAARYKDVAGIPTAVDATAGLGEDSLLLAAAGYRVTLYEYNPVIAALLADTLRRAASVPALEEIVGRMRLCEGDSLTALPALQETPDLILLDPMFPARQKSALIKKKFQLLQRLEQPCADEEALLRTAMAVRPRKLVVKRPAKGPFLAEIKPHYTIAGKAIRYDCFAFAGEK